VTDIGASVTKRQSTTYRVVKYIIAQKIDGHQFPISTKRPITEDLPPKGCKIGAPTHGRYPVTLTTVLRRLLCSATFRTVVNLVGGCVQHDTTWQFPVADPLASATERKVQELARPFWFRARSKPSLMDPRLSLWSARGSLLLSAPSKRCPAETGQGCGDPRSPLLPGDTRSVSRSGYVRHHPKSTAPLSPGPRR
jgi:hypothetical protein